MPGFLTPPIPDKAVAAMGDQRVDQRAGLVAAGRMHDEPRRLVDDQQMRVLEDDVQRDILALRLGGLGGRDLQRHLVADGEAAVGVVRRRARRPSRRPARSAF